MPSPFDKKPAAAASPAPSGGTATAVKERPAPAPAAAEPTKDVAGIDGVDADGDHVAAPSIPASGDPFADPSGVSDYKITDFLDELLILKPTEIIEEMTTEIGVAKGVVRCDVVPCTGEHAGERLDDILVFQIALKRTLTKTLDGPNDYVMGWLGKGKAGKGKSAPYILTGADPEQKAEAKRLYIDTGVI